MTKYHIEQLTLEEKIGQLMMFGFDALSLNEHAISLIKTYKAGNVILFARNIESPKQLFELNKNLQKLAKETLGIPLFIAIDQEGGMVSRITKGSTFFPGAMTIAATNEESNAYKTGYLMGQELYHLGINMNLAPVLDVNNNYKNPVIGVRSYSDDPNMVANYGSLFFKGLQQFVIATGKHFPGHGDTHVDSHLALPKVDYDKDRIHRIELVPFKKAISENIDAIMSAHIDFPAYTKDGLPVTLSKDALQGLLRNELNFKGLIISDGMNMKAIEDHYTTVEACVMAINAGVDILCVCHQEDQQIKSLERIKNAVINKEISMEVINEHVHRILSYKRLLKPFNLDQDFEGIKSIVINQESKDFALNVVRNAATIVKGKPFVQRGKVLFLGSLPKATTEQDESDGDYDAVKMIHKYNHDVDAMTCPLNPSDEALNQIITQASAYDQIIFTTYHIHMFEKQRELLEKLIHTKKEIHVISLRNPYDLFYVKDIENYVCLYEYTPNSIKVLLEYLKGDLKLKGKVPVKYA